MTTPTCCRAPNSTSASTWSSDTAYYRYAMHVYHCVLQVCYISLRITGMLYITAYYRYAIYHCVLQVCYISLRITGMLYVYITAYYRYAIYHRRPCWVGSVGSVSASRTVGREFASRPGHTKDHHKNGTNCLPAWHAMH